MTEQQHPGMGNCAEIGEKSGNLQAGCAVHAGGEISADVYQPATVMLSMPARSPTPPKRRKGGNRHLADDRQDLDAHIETERPFAKNWR